MSRTYSVAGPNQSDTADRTAVNVIAGTTIRPMIYDVLLDSAETPTDQATLWTVGRTNSTGFSPSTPTPEPLDPADVASACSTGITHTFEPTYVGLSLLQISMNKRHTFRWTARRGRELIGLAVPGNGIGVKLSTATASLIMNATVQWRE